MRSQYLVTWVTSQSAFESCQVANFEKSPDIRMLNKSRNVLRKMQSKKVSLKIANEGNLKNVEILCYTDAIHANLKCGLSQGAYLIWPCGNGKLVPVSWQSKKIIKVTKSPLASKILALNDRAEILVTYWQYI